MISVEARLADGSSPAVRATGTTLAHAVRLAARELHLGSGQTRSREQIGPREWLWNWSGKILHVVVKSRSMSQDDLRAVGGRVVVGLRLSPAALAALDEQRGDESRGQYLERLLLRS